MPTAKKVDRRLSDCFRKIMIPFLQKEIDDVVAETKKQTQSSEFKRAFDFTRQTKAFFEIPPLEKNELDSLDSYQYKLIAIRTNLWFEAENELFESIVQLMLMLEPSQDVLNEQGQLDCEKVMKKLDTLPPAKPPANFSQVQFLNGGSKLQQEDESKTPLKRNDTLPPNRFT